MHTVMVNPSWWIKGQSRSRIFPSPCTMKEQSLSWPRTFLVWLLLSIESSFFEIPVHHPYDYWQASPTCVKQSYYWAKRNISFGIGWQFHVLASSQIPQEAQERLWITNITSRACFRAYSSENPGNRANSYGSTYRWVSKLVVVLGLLSNRTSYFYLSSLNPPNALSRDK